MNKQSKVEILNYMSKTNNYLTAEQISKNVNMSSKTVYRGIKQINSEFDQPIIYSEKGKGYKLNYELYIKLRESSSSKSNVITAVERRNIVMKELLINSPEAISINKLYDQYYVSDTVIFNDEKVIISILENFNLKFKRIRKFVSVIGDESDVRQALRAISYNVENFDYTQLRFGDDIEINNNDMKFVLKQLKYIESVNKKEIPYPYDVNIFAHLYIIINRVRKKATINHLGNNSFTKHECNTIADNKELFNIAENVISELETYLKVKLSRYEVYHLFQYLLSSRLTNDIKPNLQFTSIVCDITNAFIYNILSTLSFENSEDVFYELAEHVRPLIYRLENNIKINNKLLDSIKSEYNDLFIDVKKTAKLVESKYNLAKISEDEIGYIVLYFARIIEQNPRIIRAVIMCTSGVGTSELLKVKISKKIPNIEIVSVIATRELDKSLETLVDIDLVISTVDLEVKQNINVVLVSAMFTDMDIKQVNEAIKELE